jgi:beta-lactamase class A
MRVPGFVVGTACRPRLLSCLAAIAPLALASCAPKARPAVAPSPSAVAEAAHARVGELVRQSGADVAVAFRTLDGSQEWFVRADERFHAASTMKVPVMIELFRQADAGRLSLDEPVTVVNEFRSLAGGSPFSLPPDSDSEAGLYQAVGQPRTYRELCELMITVSSNLATNNLVERLGVDRIRATVAALGAGGMDVRRGVEDTAAFRAGLNNTTTARALLVLLEAIASGTAASPESCRQMMAILERQRFNDGIPAGLPPGTIVAHKTGSVTGIQHDAAVVLGDRPYVLVVLVRGIDDEARGNALIADVARAVHAVVAAR